MREREWKKVRDRNRKKKKNRESNEEVKEVVRGMQSKRWEEKGVVTGREKGKGE